MYIGQTSKSLLNRFGHHRSAAKEKRKLYVEWGSINTAGTSMFKISHIDKMCEGKNIMRDGGGAFMN